MALYERDGNGNLKTIAKERYWISDGDTVYLWDEGQPRDTKTAKRIRFSDLSANEYFDPKTNQSYEQAMADPNNKDKTKQILDVVTKMKDVYGLDVKTSWEPSLRMFNPMKSASC
jgi:hypothetical protein